MKTLALVCYPTHLDAAIALNTMKRASSGAKNLEMKRPSGTPGNTLTNQNVRERERDHATFKTSIFGYENEHRCFVDLTLMAAPNNTRFVAGGDASVLLGAINRKWEELGFDLTIQSIFLPGFPTYGLRDISSPVDRTAFIRTNLDLEMRKREEVKRRQGRPRREKATFDALLAYNYRNLSLAYQFGGVLDFSFIKRDKGNIKFFHPNSLNPHPEYANLMSFVDTGECKMQSWLKGFVPFDYLTIQIFEQIKVKLMENNLVDNDTTWDNIPDDIVRLIVLAANSPDKTGLVTVQGASFPDEANLGETACLYLINTSSTPQLYVLK